MRSSGFIPESQNGLAQERWLRSGEQGLTLLEILIGLVIWTFLAGILASSFAVNIRLQSSIAEFERGPLEAQHAFRRLSADLENMTFFDFSGSYPDRFSCQGRVDSMCFLVNTESGLRVVRYDLKEALKESEPRKASWPQKTFDLWREEYSFASWLTDQSDEKAQTEIISRGLKAGGFSLAYGMLEKSDHGKISWRDSWQAPGIPAGIKVCLAFPQRSGKNESSFAWKTFIPTGSWGKQGVF